LILLSVFLVEAPILTIILCKLKELPATKQNIKINQRIRCIKEPKSVSFKIENVTNVFNHLNGAISLDKPRDSRCCLPRKII